MKNNEDQRLLDRQRRIDADRRAQAILRKKATSVPAVMARIAAAPHRKQVTS
jgi:hypothetical protein